MMSNAGREEVRSIDGPTPQPPLPPESTTTQVAGTTGLGAWQSQRYFWKLEQIDQRAASLAQAPVPLPT